jgi:riboflavin kinase/FMN adenylyltransferase
MTEQITPAIPFAVVRNNNAVPAALKGAFVALGVFDGVHRGHHAVINTALKHAKAAGRPAAALTFEPHPRSVLQPGAPMFRLGDETAKLRLLATTGLDATFVVTFDEGLAALSAESFINDILVDRFAIAGAAIGFNFHFGNNREGSPDLLANEGRLRGFAVDIVAPFRLSELRVSSGAIRAALTAGRVAEATELLGYPWFVTGEVVHGDKRGREFGFPTANIRLPPECGLKHGIYAVRAGIDGKHIDGVANFGRRPMFDVGTVLLEVFLFDFDGDLYGKTIDVAFIEWIRPEMSFDTTEDLIHRMGEDSRLARAALTRAEGAFPPLAPLSRSVSSP